MFGIGLTEMILIAVLAVVVLGPDKLPQLGKTLARILSEFNKVKRDFRMTISDIERVGEKATGDIRSEIDEVSFEPGSGKEENALEDTGFVADDIDEVPETFEPELSPKPRKRRRRPKKAVNPVKPDASKKVAVSEKANESRGRDASLDVEKIKGTSTSVKTEAPFGPVATPEGTRQAAGVLGAKPADPLPTKRRRKPPATRAAATGRAKAATDRAKASTDRAKASTDRAKASTDRAKAVVAKPASRAKTSKTGASEAGTEKKTAAVSRPRRKPRPGKPKKPEKIIKSDSKVVGNDPWTVSGVEVEKPAPEAAPGAGSGPGPELPDKGEA